MPIYRPYFFGDVSGKRRMFKVIFFRGYFGKAYEGSVGARISIIYSIFKILENELIKHEDTTLRLYYVQCFTGTTLYTTRLRVRILLRTECICKLGTLLLNLLCVEFFLLLAN